MKISIEIYLKKLNTFETTDDGLPLVERSKVNSEIAVVDDLAGVPRSFLSDTFLLSRLDCSYGY
jgi:hypothetical protein